MVSFSSILIALAALSGLSVSGSSSFFVVSKRAFKINTWALVLTGDTALARSDTSVVFVLLIGPNMLGGLEGLDLRSALATRSFLGRRRRISVRLLDRFDALVEGGPLVLEALHSTTFHLNFVPVDGLAVGLELRDDAEKKLALDRYRAQYRK